LGTATQTVLKVETKTNRLVGSYPIVPQGMNHVPPDFEHFNEAWRCAGADGLVKPSRKGDYSLSIAE
jgi:hypothetical protein